VKVKVRAIIPPYTDAPTKSLQVILRNHAHDKLHVRIGILQLYDIMDELARRQEISGPPFRSDEEALEDLKARIAYNSRTPYRLTPSPQGRDCLGNGEWPGYECQCDECDQYLICFPEK